LASNVHALWLNTEAGTLRLRLLLKDDPAKTHPFEKGNEAKVL
jgi:hypothetical protein